MKCALIHYDPLPAQVETNRSNIRRLIGLAADQGARWVVTPELCISGYYFADVIGTDWIKPQPDDWVKRIVDLSSQRSLVIFLSHPERDAKTDKLYNTLFAISDGKLVGKHRKIEVHPGAEEAWATPGDSLKAVLVDDVRIGMLICADTWESHHGKTLADDAAQLLVVSVAWGHKYPPMDHWKRLSSETGLPVWVCNRTGMERGIDWSQAESVVIVRGEPVFKYSGHAAILLFEWDKTHMEPEANSFEVISND